MNKFSLETEFNPTIFFCDFLENLNISETCKCVRVYIFMRHMLQTEIVCEILLIAILQKSQLYSHVIWKDPRSN